MQKRASSRGNACADPLPSTDIWQLQATIAPEIQTGAGIPRALPGDARPASPSGERDHHRRHLAVRLPGERANGRSLRSNRVFLAATPGTCTPPPEAGHEHGNPRRLQPRLETRRRPGRRRRQTARHLRRGTTLRRPLRARGQHQEVRLPAQTTETVALLSTEIGTLSDDLTSGLLIRYPESNLT